MTYVIRQPAHDSCTSPSLSRKNEDGLRQTVHTWASSDLSRQPRPARRARKLDLANRNGKPSPPAPRPGPASRFWLSSQALLPHLRSTSLLNCDCGAAGIRRRRQAPVLQPPLPDNSRAYVSRPSLSYSAAAAQPSSSAASAAQRTPSCPSVASRLSPQPQTKPPRASPDPLRLRHRPRRWSLECPPVTPAHGASPSPARPAAAG